MMGPDRFLTTALGQSRLTPWFEGHVDDESYAAMKIERASLAVLVEDFLRFLITILSERSILLRTSIDAQLRREIIHVLALHTNGAPFSKITENLPQRLSREAPLTPNRDTVLFGPLAPSAGVEEILKSLTTFRFPENSSDTGRYELKDEFYAEVDSWFYHYSPTQQAEAEANLSQRGKKVLGSTIADDVFLRAAITGQEIVEFDQIVALRVRPPVLPRIPITSGFNGINVNESKGIFTSTLLGLILEVLNRSAHEARFKEHVDRLAYVVIQVANAGGHSAKLEISSWRDLQQSKLQAEDANIQARLKEEQGIRKAAAKKRQAEMLAAVAKQQQAFMDNFADDEDFIHENDAVMSDDISGFSNNAVPNERYWEFPKGSCIVCQEDLNSSKAFGILGLMQLSRIEATRPVHMEDKDAIASILAIQRVMGFVFPLKELQMDDRQQVEDPFRCLVTLSLCTEFANELDLEEDVFALVAILWILEATRIWITTYLYRK
ncbi:hypothetical protein HK101_001346 [Irineochytrium annulatum]|nr:hypothetical protein HK101_001346 [Irineochytrium annulatum]